jgi:histidinol phosphatase-like enzyme (inositol monophosphatase family)
MAELQERLDFAVAIAREAGELTMRYFRVSDLVVDRKADNSPVTRADREAEEFFRERLASACPEDAIVGEEFGSRQGSSGYTWYLDPIDGTHSFIHGVPLFGNMMGLEHDGQAVAGVLMFPALHEIVYAAQESGAWWATDVGPPATKLDVRPAHVSVTADLQGAALSTTGMESFEEAGITGALARIAASGADTRGWSDCYGHLLVATGRADAMIDPAMSVWDCAPLQSIVEEAGGRFTDLAGNATIHGGSAVSTNGLLHDAVLGVLRE